MKKILTFALVLFLITPLWIVAKASETESNFDLMRMPLSRVKNIVMANGGKIPLSMVYSAARPTKHLGDQKVLVLPMEFPDCKWTIAAGTIREKFVSQTQRSLLNFYEISSYGKYRPTYGEKGIPEWMMMPKPYNDYEDMDSLFNDAFAVAIKYGIDPLEFDEDGNGFPDLTIIIWAGNSWTVGGDKPGDFTMPMEVGNVISIGEDVRVGGFPLITLLHEYFHAMGELWDLYDYSYTSDPVGGWDLMAAGVWDGYCGINSYQRWKANWIEPETITEPGTYEVDDLNGDGPHKMYKIPLPGSNDEWLLVENRQRHGGDGYFQGCPGNGMVVYHVDDRREYKHLFNTRTKEWRTVGIEVLDPGGSPLHRTAMYGDNYGKVVISADSIPNTLPYVKNDSKKTLRIDKISSASEKMTFRLSYDTPQVPVMQVLDTLSFGRVVKGEMASQNLTFYNIGPKKLQAMLKSDSQWIDIDRTSFIGNEEPINVTINTSSLKYGLNSGYIKYDSNAGTGRVKVVVDVAPIPGDVNLDGVVDDADVELFAKYFNSSLGDPNYYKDADFNNDQKVDLIDFLMMSKNYKSKV
ncbi:MAG: hypothetical protein GX421_01400 [Caldisericales bacterium]|nr:hypothetical protein [Caldisericales bacterium]